MWHVARPRYAGRRDAAEGPPSTTWDPLALVRATRDQYTGPTVGCRARKGPPTRAAHAERADTVKGTPNTPWGSPHIM